MDMKEIVEARPMNSGDGPTSYAQNSCYQRGVLDAAKGVIVEAINQSLDILETLSFDASSSKNTFRIADFGCSTGPNTLFATENIVQAVELKHQKCMQNSTNKLEFHVFFNDHVDNDFNILFKSLPLSRQYFAAGVPGSFYTCLLPKASVHFALSSYSALCWLSKVPEQFQDMNSPAYNKGKIFYTGTDEEVSNAYLCQFLEDGSAFLSARAEELVPGGLMVLIMPSTPTGALVTQTGAGLIDFLLGSCLVDMANMGVISEDNVDSFNLPQYFPKPEELEKLIEMNNCFSIERIGTLDHPFKHLPFEINTNASNYGGAHGPTFWT